MVLKYSRETEIEMSHSGHGDKYNMFCIEFEINSIYCSFTRKNKEILPITMYPNKMSAVYFNHITLLEIYWNRYASICCTILWIPNLGIAQYSSFIHCDTLSNWVTHLINYSWNAFSALECMFHFKQIFVYNVMFINGIDHVQDYVKNG